jgi:PiT family inorganic phosphate transporter
VYPVSAVAARFTDNGFRWGQIGSASLVSLAHGTNDAQKTGLVEIAPPQGLAAESASAAVILASSHLGFALSTTHVATGSILGSGVGKPAPGRCCSPG